MEFNPPRYHLNIKDPGSALTHFIGFVAALSASPFLIGHMIDLHAPIKTIIGCMIFCLGMLLLYGASTTYHTINTNALIFKKIDHMMIFVLIAGSYTPICLTLLGSQGIILLTIIWLLALIGIVMMLFFVTCPKWVSSIAYIAMGWACIFALPSIIAATSTAGIIWLVTGGIIYTIGGVIYALKIKALQEIFPCFGLHEIFHIFVMGGTFCHFIFMYFYLI